MKSKLNYILPQLEKIKKENLYRQLRFGYVDKGFIIINKKKLLNLCSNDYLGIPTTKLLLKQMQSSSRLVSGNDASFEILEKKLAKHKSQQGAMSVGYVPEFFSKFKSKLFSTIRIPVPNKYRLPKGYTYSEFKNYCLNKLEKLFSKDNSIAAFVMESGAQVAGGVIIYPVNFQKKISKICKKHGVLLIVDEVATGFGRLGSMIQYKAQDSQPDIIAFGKMLTGGYLPMAATLTTKKVYDSFLGEFHDFKHLFHGHTYTGNPIAATLANENLKLYEKFKLIEKIQKTSKIFEKYYTEILELKHVGDIRHKGMLMGIELVEEKRRKTPFSSNKSINKIVFERGKKHGIYLRTLGNIVMLVPPLAISHKELNLLIQRTIETIKTLKR